MATGSLTESNGYGHQQYQLHMGSQSEQNVYGQTKRITWLQTQ